MNMAETMQDVAENVETEEVEIELPSEEGKETETLTEAVEQQQSEETQEVSEDHDQEVAEYSDSVKNVSTSLPIKCVKLRDVNKQHLNLHRV